MIPEPVVTYRCVVNGCGNVVAGIFTAEDGRPVLAHKQERSDYRDIAMDEWVGPWVEPEEVTPGPMQRTWEGITTGTRFSPRPVEIACVKHGRWHLTKEQVRRAWAEGPHTEKLEPDTRTR